MRPEFDKILTRLTNMRSRRMQLEIIRLEGKIEAEKMRAMPTVMVFTMHSGRLKAWSNRRRTPMRDRLISYLDATEDMMIFLMEQRDRPGASREEIILCNKLWNMCRVIYDALKEIIRRKNV